MGYGNTTAVSPLKVLPREIRSFANDLHAEIKAEKKLLQLFLENGAATPKLSAGDWESLNGEKLFSDQTDEQKDGTWVYGPELHCEGVFTDEKGVVYFWKLLSPRLLSITSQNYEATFLVLKKSHPELIRK